MSLTKNQEPGLILYGGAFDPPHEGHLKCIQEARDRFPHAEILIVPEAQPAGAEGLHKSPQLSLKERVELCRLTFNALLSDQVKIHPLEGSQPNYTIDLLHKIKRTSPEQKLCLLLGQDQLEKFHKWHLPLEILKIADLLVIKREAEEPKAEEQTNLIATIFKLLDILSLAHDTEDDVVVIKNLGSRIYFIDRSLSLASSSKIKDILKKGEKLPKTWLNKDVFNLMNSKRNKA